MRSLPRACVGPKMGKPSPRNSTTTFTYRCCSKHAWGCIKQARIVESFVDRTVELQEAVGWPHKHEGLLMLKRGLPPQLIIDIKAVTATHPNIKLGALRTHLLEVKKWSTTFSQRIGTYHYNHLPRAEMLLGVSAFGTVQQLIAEKAADRVLNYVDADLDTTFVIGARLDVGRGRMLVLNTSIKMAMFAICPGPPGALKHPFR